MRGPGELGRAHRDTLEKVHSNLARWWTEPEIVSGEALVAALFIPPTPVFAQFANGFHSCVCVVCLLLLPFFVSALLSLPSSDCVANAEQAATAIVIGVSPFFSLKNVATLLL